MERTPSLCPICERGKLIEVSDKVWQCERKKCNNEFFHDTDGTLNVRDKPKPRSWNEVIQDYFKTN